jgi:hypothetical protein
VILPSPPPRCAIRLHDGERCREVFGWCLPVDVEILLAHPRHRPGARWPVVLDLERTRSRLATSRREAAELLVELQTREGGCPC